MPKDLTLMLDDRPGTVAEAFEALGNAGINVEGGCGLAVAGGKGELHLLVEDSNAAKQALSGAGVQIAKEQEAIVTAVEDTPGAAGRLLRRVAEAGVNLNAVYLASNTRIVIAGDNLEAAREHLQAGVGAPQAHT